MCYPIYIFEHTVVFAQCGPWKYQQKSEYKLLPVLHIYSSSISVVLHLRIQPPADQVVLQNYSRKISMSEWTYTVQTPAVQRPTLY